jgi:hypothetical protein
VTNARPRRRAFFFASSVFAALGFARFSERFSPLAILMRLIALIMIVAALVLLGADALTSLERGGEITVRSFGAVWAALNPASLAHFKDWVQHDLPFMAQGVYSALAIPGWGLIGVVGVLIAFIFSRRIGPQ